MIAYVRNNIAFLGLLLLWLFAGRYASTAAYALVGLSVFLYLNKGWYSNVLFSFLYILILSDNRNLGLEFFSSFKNIFIVLLFAWMLIRSNEFQPYDMFFKKFFIFFGFALLALMFSPIVGSAIQKTISYLLLIIIVPNYFLKCYREEGEDFLRNFIYFIAVVLLSGVVLRFINPIAASTEGRFNGSLGNPNGLALFCMLFFLILFILTDYMPNLFHQTDKILLYGTVFLCLIWSGSRGSLFGILIFFIFRSLNRASPAISSVLFIALLFGYQTFTENLEGVIIFLGLEDYFRLSTLEAGSGRLIAWEFAWYQIKDNIFLGKGFSYTDEVFRQNYTMLSLKGHQGNAHNSYLTFWLDTGLFGLVSYLYAFITSFIASARYSRAAIPALYAILFSAYFESWLTASLNPFTILVFILITILLNKEILTVKETETVPSEIPAAA